MSALAAKKDELNFADLEFCGIHLIADPRGCLYWPEERILIVSDLHLEKGSSFAARKGVFIPPYDTRQTLLNLQDCITTWMPSTIVSLGDSFHDQQASLCLCDNDKTALLKLMKGTEWVWISGNHDPEPPRELGGVFCATLQLGSLRACSHHVNSQPTALKKFRHSIGVNIWQTSPIAFQTSSKVLAPAFLR